jgi:hypothetical protein
MPSGACPGFRQATSQFRQFLLETGWPERIVWVRSDVARSFEQPVAVNRCEVSEAEREFEVGRQKGLGVLLDAICTFQGATCATVLHPSDSDEAERLMYPSNGGLKMSATIPRAEGRCHGLGKNDDA